MKVYLAGPISGLTYDAGQDWRDNVAALLKEKGLEAYSPLRCKNFLRKEGIIENSYDYDPLSTAKGIVSRDRYDVMSCDAVLFNLIGATRVSIGTCVEFGWADAFRKPSVVVWEKNNIHRHPFVEELCNFHVEGLNEAVTVLSAILNP